MGTKNYSLELTEGEVRNIGSNKWLKLHKWQSICGFIGCMALMFVILLLSPEWEENHILAIVCAVLAFCSFVVPYLWWNHKMGKAGKEYLRGVTS